MNDNNHSPNQTLFGRLIGGPSGFRDGLQRLGPTFIKVGQFLALRPDLVPQDYCDELMSLLDQVPPFPWREAKTILTEELNRDPTEIFDFVNPKPVAAGSLAQVHEARLMDGTEVAIKIQRPNIRELVLSDLSRARLLARLFELSGISLIASPREIMEELTAWMMQEIDLRHELDNLSRLYQLAKGDSFERVPRPYPDLSTSKILTSEYLRGIPVSKLLLALHSNSAEGVDRVKTLGVDCDQLASNLLTACLTQIFRYQFFHADLHPGNLLALPDGVIGFVDFGLCDVLDETVRERQMRYLAAVYGGKTNLMFRSLMEILIPSEQTDVEAFRRDFFTETSTWLRWRKASEDGYPEISPNGTRSPTGQWMVNVMLLARHHRLQVPSGILLMYRALLTAESVANQLGTEMDLTSVGNQFFAKLQLEEALRVIEMNEIQGTFLSQLTLMRELPSQLQQILSELSDGRFALNVTFAETLNVRRSNNQRVRLLATSILSVGIALLLTRTQLPELFGVSLAWPLCITLILLYLWIFLQWRQLQ